VVAGAVTVVPVSRRIAVGGGLGGGAAWLVHDGPAAIEVTSAGITRIVPIRDLTLLARLAALLLVAATLVMRRRRW